jgi:hypothetical protein
MKKGAGHCPAPFLFNEVIQYVCAFFMHKSFWKNSQIVFAVIQDTTAQCCQSGNSSYPVKKNLIPYNNRYCIEKG